jgi:predicted nucleotidyltransferase
MEQLPEYWLRGIQQWAEQNGNVVEVWLFGSRARGEGTDESDVDLAVTLMPPKGTHDWAAGNYFAEVQKWRAELKEIVGKRVDLELMEFLPALAAADALLLWKREQR